MVRTTLTSMAAGGIRDHLGGGFARYSVDERWLVPHFEKMLYDNAQLARLYLWAGVEFSSQPMTEVAIDTFGYMLSDLQHPRGGFYAAEDADSEGVEGKFYVWEHSEFTRVTGNDADVAAAYFGVTPEGNFEGANILHRARGMEEVAADHGMEATEAAEAVRRAARALLEERSRRVRPALDDKVVCAWNGLAIRALAEAGAVLDSARYREAARSAALFVLGELRDDQGRLRRSWAKDRLGPPAVLEDYAALAVGLFSLYASTGEPEWYEEARKLVDDIDRLFTDPEGGFFTTDGADLVVRPKDHFDNPSPAGNSLAAEALILASAYSGDTDLWEQAEATVRAAGAVIERAPSGAGHLLGVLLALLDGPRELAVVGSDWQRLARVAWERFRPGLVVAGSPHPTEQPPVLAGRGRPEETLAYLCRRFVCDAPVATTEDLRALL